MLRPLAVIHHAGLRPHRFDFNDRLDDLLLLGLLNQLHLLGRLDDEAVGEGRLNARQRRTGLARSQCHRHVRRRRCTIGAGVYRADGSENDSSAKKSEAWTDWLFAMLAGHHFTTGWIAWVLWTSPSQLAGVRRVEKNSNDHSRSLTMPRNSTSPVLVSS